MIDVIFVPHPTQIITIKTIKLNFKRLYNKHRMVTLFPFAVDTVFTVKNSSSLIDSCLFVSAFPSTSCCGSPALLVTFSVPCVKGVTCNSQNVTGLPFRLNELADLSLPGFRMFGSIWFSFIFTSSIISVFIESV